MSTWHDFCPVILKSCQLGMTSALSYWSRANLARLLPCHFILHTIRFLTRITFYLLLQVLLPLHQIYLEFRHSPLFLHIIQHHPCTIDPQCPRQHLIMKSITTMVNMSLMILFHEDLDDKYEDHIVSRLPINNLPLVLLYSFILYLVMNLTNLFSSN